MSAEYCLKERLLTFARLGSAPATVPTTISVSLLSFLRVSSAHDGVAGRIRKGPAPVSRCKTFICRSLTFRPLAQPRGSHIRYQRCGGQAYYRLIDLHTDRGCNNIALADVLISIGVLSDRHTLRVVFMRHSTLVSIYRSSTLQQHTPTLPNTHPPPHSPTPTLYTYTTQARMSNTDLGFIYIKEGGLRRL